jgi:hypothetical protein
MGELTLNEYTIEKSVYYRGELYLVRDNGSICRQPKLGEDIRKFDNVWIFGKQNRTTGYMRFNGQVVHKIVATAFYGEQPSSVHVVDHIDTNRGNNRAENLRWVTRLENLTANTKTLRSIKKKWGSVEAMLNDPNRKALVSPLRNRSWMPQSSLKTLIVDSLTPVAKQQNWLTPNAFPLCPEIDSIHPLWEYFSELLPGAIFSHNKFGETVIEKAELSDDGSFISVVTKIIDGIKDFGHATITYERGKFIHKAHGVFFTVEAATKSHFEKLGKLRESNLSKHEF